MSYKLRFVQQFQLNKTAEFMQIEKQFAKFEEEFPDFPKGKRYIPQTGRQPSNTLIWECDFHSLEALQEAHNFLMSDSRHEDLFQEQSKYIVTTW